MVIETGLCRMLRSGRLGGVWIKTVNENPKTRIEVTGMGLTGKKNGMEPKRWKGMI